MTRRPRCPIALGLLLALLVAQGGLATRAGGHPGDGHAPALVLEAADPLSDHGHGLAIALTARTADAGNPVSIAAPAVSPVRRLPTAVFQPPEPA